MSKGITERAIAYLKGSPDDPRLAVNLSRKDQPVVRSFLDNLHICYLVDKGQSYEYIQNFHLEEAEISANELHQIGLRNLERLVAQRTSRVQPYGNVYAFQMGGDFEASVMLLDEFWDKRFREFVVGQYAAVVPTRDILAFCDAHSDTAIEELKLVVSRVWPSGDHLISDKIYIRQNNTWQPAKH